MTKDCETCIYAVFDCYRKRSRRFLECQLTQCSYKPTYETRQKLVWKNIEKRFQFMTDQDKGYVAYELLHTAYEWVPKRLIFEIYKWLVEGLQNERLEIKLMTEKRREQFKVLEAINDTDN